MRYQAGDRWLLCDGGTGGRQHGADGRVPVARAADHGQLQRSVHHAAPRASLAADKGSVSMLFSFLPNVKTVLVAHEFMGFEHAPDSQALHELMPEDSGEQSPDAQIRLGCVMVDHV